MQPENPPPLPSMPPPVPPGNAPYYAPPPRGGMPVWAMVLGGCLGGGCIILVILGAILLPVVGQARVSAQRTTCLSNLKQIGLGTMMYAEDYDQQLPPAAEWQTNVEPYIKNDRVFHCPAATFNAGQTPTTGSSYAYDSALDRMKQARIAEPQNAILVYDSTNFSPNANDAVTSLPVPGRHKKSNNISFADGHARYWSDEESLPQVKILPDTP